MRDMFRNLAKNYDNLPLVCSPKNLCTDNASMISWMGWELLNCEQDVNIRDLRINGYKKIPLGNYVVGLTNVKGSPTG